MKVKLSVLFLLLTGVLFLASTKARVTTDTFVVLIENGGSLGFQGSPTQTVYLNVTSGSFNSSYAEISIYSGGGYFVFRGNNSVSFDVVKSGDIPVITEINNTIVAWGAGLSLTSSDTFLLRWSITLAPFLPIKFIFGSIGLVCMFVAPLYCVHLFKKKKYQWALVQLITVGSIGVGLVLAWLWGS